jgi:hypothetical protein
MYRRSVPRAINVCPNCGEPVTQFAAGCAICGEDLEAARRRQAQRRSLPEIPSVPAVHGAGGDALFAAVLVIVALFAPPFGLVLGLFMAYRFESESRPMMRNVALLCAGASLISIAFPFGVYEKVLTALF